MEKQKPTRPRILDAAVRCIEKHGLEGTTMEAIAAEAGVVRKTVYLTFGNRKGLLDAILLQKVGSNVEKMKRYLDGFDTLEEAIRNGCLRHVSLIRRDDVFFQTLRSAHDIALDRYLLGADSPAHDMMIEIWQETFHRARQRGELRADAADAELANWLLCVISFLLVRDDFSTRNQTDMLEKFVLRALRPDR